MTNTEFIDGIDIDQIKTADEATDLYNQIQLDVILIEDQILAANQYYIEYGKYQNPDWYRRAKMALRFKKRAISNLQQIAGKLAKNKRAFLCEARDKKLFNAMRDRLGEEVFFQIVEGLGDAK